MDYAPTSAPRKAASTKIVIAGGFGVGKTTLVGSVSEIVPLRTEALVTNESEGVDDLEAVPDQVDHHRGHGLRSADPGRGPRALPVRDARASDGSGSCGTTCAWAPSARSCWSTPPGSTTSFSPLDYFESKGLPFIVAVNQFDDAERYSLEEVADALALPADVPIISVDARDRESAKQALVRVTEYALERLTQSLSAKVN